MKETQRKGLPEVKIPAARTPELEAWELMVKSLQDNTSMEIAIQVKIPAGFVLAVGLSVWIIWRSIAASAL